VHEITDICNWVRDICER